MFLCSVFLLCAACLFVLLLVCLFELCDVLCLLVHSSFLVFVMFLLNIKLYTSTLLYQLSTNQKEVNLIFILVFLDGK